MTRPSACPSNQWFNPPTPDKVPGLVPMTSESEDVSFSDATHDSSVHDSSANNPVMAESDAEYELTGRISKLHRKIETKHAKRWVGPRCPPCVL